MYSKVTIVLIVLFSFTWLSSRAQTDRAEHKINIRIPEVALLGLVAENNTNATLGYGAPNEAGEAIHMNGLNNNRVWINYSSVISASTPKRKVVGFVQGEIPEGLKLMVEASEYSGSGKGKLGKSNGWVALSNQPSDVIVDIGTCYTGKGANNGHCLTYKLEQDENAAHYALITEHNSPINVVYTLTDYN